MKECSYLIFTSAEKPNDRSYVYVCVCVRACVCASVYVCVWEREREFWYLCLSQFAISNLLRTYFKTILILVVANVFFVASGKVGLLGKLIVTFLLYSTYSLFFLWSHFFKVTLLAGIINKDMLLTFFLQTFPYMKS